MERVRKLAGKVGFPILIVGAIGAWVLSLLLSYKGFELLTGRDPKDTLIAVVLITAVEVFFFWLVLPRLVQLSRRFRRWLYPQRRRR